MEQKNADKKLVAFCGLYCGSCSLFIKNKCKGCAQNDKATWCKIRTCCMSNKRLSCADCKSYPNPDDCKYFNNFISRIFAFLFKSNRKACIEMIREKGIEAFAQKMATEGTHSIK